MFFKMFFGKVWMWLRLRARRAQESLGLGWTHLIGRIKSYYSSLHIKRQNYQDSIWEFFSRFRRNFVERVARMCAYFIDFRNDIRMRLDDIFQSRLIKAQTLRPVRIQAEVQADATWMFFRTTHPVITTEHLTFNGSRMQPRKQTPMVKALFRIPGVAEVALMRYNVRVTRGSMFPVKELTPKVMAVLRQHLV